jgi:mannose-1-phosphate guanylyltransferase
MAKPEQFAVILAGGGGTRLWPASRRSRPKQLLSLGASESLLAATFRRLSALVGPERTLIVTAADQAQAIREASARPASRQPGGRASATQHSTGRGSGGCAHRATGRPGCRDGGGAL